MTAGGLATPDDGKPKPVTTPPEDRQRATSELVRRGIPGGAAHLALVRRELRAWAATAGLSIQDIDGLLLASYEALANAAEHAYSGDGPRLVDLVATQHSGGYVQVVVQDYGSWRPEPADSGFRGRGLVMIRNLAHDAEIRKEAEGTTVVMRWRQTPNH